jgi:UDPglucose--hexose-1-phosphate uridylyltransferase
MSEVRRDIVTDTWVIVETDHLEVPRDHLKSLRKPPACPFCAGNEAMTPPEVFAARPEGGERNGPGWRVRVIPDRRPVLRIEGKLERVGVGIHDMVTGIGANEVVVEAPDHVTDFARLPDEQVELVLRTWRDRLVDLYRDQRFRYVLVFKDHGTLAGGSTIEHVHSQIIALPATPRRVKDQLDGARNYYEYKERCIFCDILQDELRVRDRVLLETERFAVFAPYASRLPFELRVMPRRHCFSYAEATDEEFSDLAGVLKRALAGLFRALDDPPFNLVLHTAPNLLPHEGYWTTVQDDYHWFLEVIPRVRRTDGFEWGSGFFINPVAPERAVTLLKEVL